MVRLQVRESVRWLGALSLCAAPLLTEEAHAEAAGPEVLAFAETEEALFFQPANAPQAVWYVPRTETRFGVVEPVLPGVPPSYRAAVVVGAVDAALADVSPAWAGLTLAPYPVRPTVECTLRTRPGMRFVQQMVRALGSDKGGGVRAPVCEFTFRLPTLADPALLAALEEDAAAGRLIDYQFQVALQQPLRVAWEVVHEALSNQLGARADAKLTQAEAESAIDASLRGALVLLFDAMTPDERAAFAALALERLFMTVGTSQQLVPYSPAGAVTYHVVRSEHRL